MGPSSLAVAGGLCATAEVGATVPLASSSIRQDCGTHSVAAWKPEPSLGIPFCQVCH